MMEGRLIFLRAGFYILIEIKPARHVMLVEQTWVIAFFAVWKEQGADYHDVVDKQISACRIGQ